MLKTRTTAKDDVSRELRIRLKKALDEMGVKLPSLNTIVLSGFDGAASVNGAKPPRTRPTAVDRARRPRKATEGPAPAKRHGRPGSRRPARPHARTAGPDSASRREPERGVT